MLELNRISGHFFVIANMLKSLAANVPLSFAIEIREEIYELFEKISGARIHNNHITFGGVARDINYDVLENILNLYINKILQAIDNIEDFATDNPVFKQRTVDIGKLIKI
jgi:NADH:ubiquinone oxidoreductase subunit D